MFREVNDTTIRIRQRSGTPHVAFVHALGAGLWTWEGVADRLPADWGITLYDLRGHGLSGGAGETLSIHACDLTALAPAGAVLAGLSIGGQIAMLAAAETPGRFAGLVLADTLPRIGTVERYAARAARVRAEGMAAFAAEQVIRWFAPAFAAANPAAVDGARRALTRQPVAGYAAACTAIGAGDLTERLPELDLPALCLAGALDASTSPDAMRTMAQDLPRGEMAIVAGAGHMAPFEAPEKVADLLARFVRARHSTA